MPEPDGDKTISIDDLDGLIALAQAGALEIHIRGSTIDGSREANRLVFDLDPGPGVNWNELIAAAREVRERLDALGMESFVKTSGGKASMWSCRLPTPLGARQRICPQDRGGDGAR